MTARNPGPAELYDLNLLRITEFLLISQYPLDILQPLTALPHDLDTKLAFSRCLQEWFDLQDKINATSRPLLEQVLHDFQMNSILLASSLAQPGVIDVKQKIRALEYSLEYLGMALTENRYSGLGHWDNFANKMQLLEETFTHQHTQPPNPLLGKLMFCAGTLLTLGVACLGLTTGSLCALLFTVVMSGFLLTYIFNEIERETVGDQRGDAEKVKITRSAAVSLEKLSLFRHHVEQVANPAAPAPNISITLVPA